MAMAAMVLTMLGGSEVDQAVRFHCGKLEIAGRHIPKVGFIGKATGVYTISCAIHSTSFSVRQICGASMLRKDAEKGCASIDGKLECSAYNGYPPVD